MINDVNSGLSWNGTDHDGKPINIHVSGDSKSIKAVESALHHSSTIPQLRARINEITDRHKACNDTLGEIVDSTDDGTDSGKMRFSATLHRECVNVARKALGMEPIPDEVLTLPETYEYPMHGWTCFFCGETFKTIGSARDHFGNTPLSQPGCQIKVGEERGLLMALRRAEEELTRYRADDSDVMRQMNNMAFDHAQNLIRAEEVGYDKAILDIMHGKAEPELAQRIIASLTRVCPPNLVKATETKPPIDPRPSEQVSEPVSWLQIGLGGTALFILIMYAIYS